MLISLINYLRSREYTFIFMVLMLNYRNSHLENRIKELEEECQKSGSKKDVSKNDLKSIIPKLVLMTQVFGNVIETCLKKGSKDVDANTLKRLFKEYCMIKSDLEQDKLCRYVMNNPKVDKDSKITSTQAITRFNSLIEGTKIYTEEDFDEVMRTIEDHPNEKHKNELFTICSMFANSNGVSPEKFLDVISGSKINFNKKAFIVYLMKKSQSIVKISGHVLQTF